MKREDDCSGTENQISKSFPATQFYGSIPSCDCAECTHVREELRPKRWDQISTTFLDFTCSPTLLTPEAFNALLPAYLLRTLDDLDRHSVVVEFTVYSLCPDKPEKHGQEEQGGHEDKLSRLVQRAGLMNPIQI
jgi:hypothetical protein